MGLVACSQYGATGFALQFMLDTSLEDDLKFPLKARDLVVMDLDRSTAPVKVMWASGPDQVIHDLQCAGMKGDRFHRPMYISKDMAEYDGKMMFVDPSGRGKDRTGYAVVNHLKGQLFVRRWGSLDGGYDDKTLETLAHIARTEGVHEIVAESNFGDGMYSKLFKPVLQRIYPCKIEEQRATSQKEMRIIDTLEPLMNQHRLIVDPQIIRVDLKDPKDHSCIYQMTRVCRQVNALSHDDALDALAGACAYWTERLRETTHTVEEDHEREMLNAELDKWLEEMGQTGQGHSFRPDRAVHR